MSDELRRRSVTRDDTPNARTGGGVLQFIVPSNWAVHIGLPASAPAYWSPMRDFTLQATLDAESMWSSAIAKAITQIASRGWEVSDTNDSALRTKRAQEVLLQADDRAGWVPFLQKHLQNFLLCDNGAFVEVVRATNSMGSKILGLMHLDAMRCTRTGDPHYPVIYRSNTTGKEHVLRDYQVLSFADMPNPGDSYHGVGRCAASRAYKTIHKLAGLELYVDEKVTGSRALAIHFVSGLSSKQLEDAIATADADMKTKGRIAYKGAVIVPVLGDTPVTIATVPLAEIPDGFDAKQERDNAYVIYANAIGVAVQDIQPLSGQGLGTGTQTIVLDEAAKGQGLAAWSKQWEHMVNEHVLPASTTFAWSTNDIRDQKAESEVRKARADTRAVQIESGEITVQEARQLAVDANDLPREFIAKDVTPAGTLQDNEKPLDAVTPVVAVKAAHDLFAEELRQAQRLYRSIA